MNNIRKSFLLHFDSLEILDELTNEQCGLLFKACRDFNLGVEVNLDPTISLVFFSFKKQFERDKEKYQKTVDRNKANGSKGGRPFNTKTQDNPKEPTGLIGNPLEPKQADSGNDSGSDNDSDNDNESGSVLLKDIVIPSRPVKPVTINYTQEFLLFWKEYPSSRRGNKKRAFANWKKIDPSLYALIINHVTQRKAEDTNWLKEGGAFIIHAEGFLSGDRWEDSWSVDSGLSEKTEVGLRRLKNMNWGD
jgi:hypothetical protein